MKDSIFVAPSSAIFTNITSLALFDLFIFIFFLLASLFPLLCDSFCFHDFYSFLNYTYFGLDYHTKFSFFFHCVDFVLELLLNLYSTLSSFICAFWSCFMEIVLSFLSILFRSLYLVKIFIHPLLTFLLLLWALGLKLVY